jgi:hypothetical protein
MNSENTICVFATFVFLRTMRLISALKVEQDLQRARREEMEKRGRADRPDDKNDPHEFKPEVYRG